MKVPESHYQLSDDAEARVQRAWSVRKAHFPDEITLDRPGKTLALSTTGSDCGLDCAHCGGHYLEGMTPLWNAEQALAQGDYSSCLFSGGCTPQGKVEVAAQAETIRRFKAKGLRINMHAGLVSDEEIAVIAPLADKISFDIVTDEQTIRDVFGLSRSGSDYINVYKKLRAVGAPVVPHICIGLWGGVVRGEYDALDALAELGADGLVFIVLIPTPGTRFADRLPPSLESVAGVLTTAREKFPTLSINMGCMRPQGKYRAALDCLALRCGVNRIVNPTPKVERLAAELGLKVIERRECCVL